MCCLLLHTERMAPEKVLYDLFCNAYYLGPTVSTAKEHDQQAEFSVIISVSPFPGLQTAKNHDKS